MPLKRQPVAVARMRGPSASESDDLSVLVTIALHEIRQPVQTVDIATAILLSELAGPVTEHQRVQLNAVQTAARRLRRLTQDLEVLSAGERGFVVEPSWFDLLEAVETVCGELALVAERHRVNVSIDAPRNTQWSVQADRLRIEEILANLVENAVRYCQVDSNVDVRLRRSHSRVLVTVTNALDEGVSDETAGWFKLFVRGDSGRRSDHPGLGIGLAVVAMLVDAHGGQLLGRARDGLVTIGFTLPTC
jgi:signal transduction histidine kinase